MFARHHGKSAREVLRKGGAEIERLASHGVVECEPGRVEEVALGRKSGHTTSSASAIHVVAHDRMADRREMNADLVSPSGMEMRTKKVPRVEPGKAYEVGLGRPTFIDDCHALPVSRIPGYWLVDREGVAGDMAPGHHRIAPDDPAGGYRRAQKPVRAVGFCHHEQSRGLLVETVHHSGSLRLSFTRQCPTPPEQSVHEGATPVTRRGVDDHPGRLVDHEQRLVLVDDRDGDRLPRDRSLLHLRDFDAHHVSRSGSITGLLRSSTHEDVSLRDQSRRLGAGKLCSLGNKEIEADIAVRLDWKLSDVAQS